MQRGEPSTQPYKRREEERKGRVGIAERLWLSAALSYSALARRSSACLQACVCVCAYQQHCACLIRTLLQSWVNEWLGAQNYWDSEENRCAASWATAALSSSAFHAARCHAATMACSALYSYDWDSPLLLNSQLTRALLKNTQKMMLVSGPGDLMKKPNVDHALRGTPASLAASLCCA